MFDTAIDLESAVEFAENPEPRCPCVLLLDTSGSMSGAPIAALNEGLAAFRAALDADELARKRVEIATITFDSHVKIVQDFITADRFEAPILTAQGLTSIGTAATAALEAIADRKQQYRNSGISYYRPWIFLITDGESQGETPEIVAEATQRIREEEEAKRVAFFAVGVENANMNALSRMVVRAPLKLKGLQFREMFLWLSTSMQRVSHSQPEDQVPLPPPGWGAV